MSESLYRLIRDVPDFPKPGILFRDITPLLLSHGGLTEAVDRLAAPYRKAAVSHVLAIESRGFILGSPVALTLQAGLVIVRKPGKLPARTHKIEYALEYGSDTLELHADAMGTGDRVLVVDDVLATGGTAAAVVRLIERSGATLAGFSFLIELADLGGRAKLGDAPFHAVLRYPRQESDAVARGA
jgi:adenine phosphoribosyltransferase